MRKSTMEDRMPHAVGTWRNAADAAKEGQLVYTCRTITPLFGGGVTAGEIDPDIPVRAIGETLRNWWRLLQPADQSPQKLFETERSVWGGVSDRQPTASQVRVVVRKCSRAELTDAFEYRKKPDDTYKTPPLALPGMNEYALFPARGSLYSDKLDFKEPPKKVARPGIRFELQIEAPGEYHKDLMSALRWWASFGGIGARTRRGLGRITIPDLMPVTPEEVERLGGRLILGNAVDDPIEAWNKAVNQLRDFRQGQDIGRDPGPGRSRWPEADAIRRFAKSPSTRHPPRHPVDKLYPRAAFGLPIDFHFIDSDDPKKHTLEPSLGDRKDRDDDPKDHSLEPSSDDRFESSTRMASPVILGPYWDGQGYCPAALLLPAWREALALSLRFQNKKGKTLTCWPADLDDRKAAASQISPMAGYGDDPLSAFMAYFDEKVRAK